MLKFQFQTRKYFNKMCINKCWVFPPLFLHEHLGLAPCGWAGSCSISVSQASLFLSNISTLKGRLCGARVRLEITCAHRTPERTWGWHENYVTSTVSITCNWVQTLKAWQHCPGCFHLFDVRSPGQCSMMVSWVHSGTHYLNTLSSVNH